MTNPRITAVHGYLDDCAAVVDWVEHNTGVGNLGFTSNGDVFDIVGTLDSAGDEHVYYERDIANVLTSQYPVWVIRWRTSEAANALGCRVSVIYNDASEEFLVGAGHAVFSSDGSWTVSTGTFPAGKTVDQVRIYASDYPNSIDSGTSHVYVDFILFCQQIWEFPYVANRVSMDLVNNYGDASGLDRVGDITHYSSSDSGEIVVEGEMDDDPGWGTPPGHVLMDISTHANSEPWQFFWSNLGNFKVTLRDLNMREDQESQVRSFSVLLKELRCSSATSANEPALSRFGF